MDTVSLKIPNGGYYGHSLFRKILNKEYYYYYYYTEALINGGIKIQRRFLRAGVNFNHLYFLQSEN